MVMVKLVPLPALLILGKDDLDRPELPPKLYGPKLEYPLVNIQKAMENHHVLWENPLFRLGHFPLLFVCSPEGIDVSFVLKGHLRFTRVSTKPSQIYVRYRRRKAG